MRLLLVEDDLKLGKFTKLMLESQGYVVTWVKSGSEAMDYIVLETFEVIILDWMLPDISGVDVIKRCRLADVNIPIIMMTARGTIDDKVEGFNAGADDYIVKPFEFDELHMRILALGRRSFGRMTNELKYEMFEVDYHEHNIKFNDIVLELTRKEYLLMKVLIEHKGGIVSKDMIMEHVYTIDEIVSDNAIESLIRRIRAKIGNDISPFIIKVVRNMGYRLIKHA